MNIWWKAPATLLLLLLFAWSALLIAALPAGPARRRDLLARNASIFARLALRIVQVRVASRRLQRKGIRRRRRTFLVLSNHLSYVDVLVLASRMPAVFITSIELKRTFPLGVLAALGGSIFVERRSPAGLKEEIALVSRVLEQGTSVVLFPEATTSDGETVRPFKSALITAAIASGADLLPVCLRYCRINGRPVDPGNRDRVFFHGGMTFLEHLPRFLSLRQVTVECIVRQPFSAHQRLHRKELAARAHDLIRSAYHEQRRNSPGQD